MDIRKDIIKEIQSESVKESFGMKGRQDGISIAIQHLIVILGLDRN